MVVSVVIVVVSVAIIAVESTPASSVLGFGVQAAIVSVELINRSAIIFFIRFRFGIGVNSGWKSVGAKGITINVVSRMATYQNCFSR